MQLELGRGFLFSMLPMPSGCWDQKTKLGSSRTVGVAIQLGASSGRLIQVVKYAQLRHRWRFGCPMGNRARQVQPPHDAGSVTIHFRDFRSNDIEPGEASVFLPERLVLSSLWALSEIAAALVADEAGCVGVLDHPLGPSTILTLTRNNWG